MKQNSVRYNNGSTPRESRDGRDEWLEVAQPKSELSIFSFYIHYLGAHRPDFLQLKNEGRSAISGSALLMKRGGYQSGRPARCNRPDRRGNRTCELRSIRFHLRLAATSLSIGIRIGHASLLVLDDPKSGRN